MKGIYLFLQRIKQYIQNNRMMVGIFLVGGIVNTVVMLYCYGNLLPVVANRNLQSLEYRSYSVYAVQASTVQEKLERLLQDPLIQGIAVVDENRVHACLGDYPIKSAGGSVTFTNSRQMIVHTAAEVRIGETLSYQGQDFQVIGVSTWNQAYFIPWDAFLELSGLEAITEINVIAKERQSPYHDAVKALLQELFPDNGAVYGTADTLLILEDNASQQYFPLIMIGAFLAVVAQIFLLYNILDSGRKENAVLRTVGLSKGGLAGLVLLESAASCAVANGLGILVYLVLYEPVFTKLNIYPDIQYSIADYSLIYLLLLILSLLASIPILWKAAGTTPVNAGRKAL